MAWACKEQSTNEHPLSCSQCRTLHYANDYTMIAHRKLKAALESDCCFDGTQRGLHTQAEGHASDGTAQCREMGAKSFLLATRDGVWCRMQTIYGWYMAVVNTKNGEYDAQQNRESMARQEK